ncbi:MAG TPA: CdaR family protein [Candidatus Limnocylindrales bacterium]
MRRFLGRVVHNWPLKLAAIGLATLMYGGLVLSESTQTFNGDIAVVPKGQPADTFLLTVPPHVTVIRYFAPAGVPVTSSSFTASVDLSSVDPQAGTVSVRIDVSSPDVRIRVLGYEPQFMSVQLDPIDEKTVPVQVERGVVPPGLDLGDTTVTPANVVVSGPQSIVRQVAAVRADVQIQPSGIDVDQDVQLVPIDGVGNAVRTVDVTPSTARVTIPVFSNRQTRSLPVNPVLTGVPAAGFEIASVTVNPQIVLVEGDADQLAQLVSIDTSPISMTGVSANSAVQASLALPTGIVAVGPDSVQVSIKLRQVTETRTFSAGLRLVGTRRDLTYDFTTDRIIVTIGGSPADLDRLTGSALLVDLDVTGLGPGTVDVPVSIDLPTGPTLVSANPATVTVTITATATPSPPAGPSPSPSGG